MKYTIQNSPFIVPTDDGKIIKEHFGKASDGNSDISIAHMVAPPGWSEPFQTPEFDEYTFILSQHGYGLFSLFLTQWIG